MCKKCSNLMKIWWKKQKLVYKLLTEGSKHEFFAIEAERNSSRRALNLQTKKHIGKERREMWNNERD